MKIYDLLSLIRSLAPKLFLESKYSFKFKDQYDE